MTPQEVLYRGVKGSMPAEFFKPDSKGMLCAVDFGFMSTSRAVEVPLSYMNARHNVLFVLHCRSEDSMGYHHGCDISSISQFPHEKEILFPPSTLLQVGLVAGMLG